MILRKEIAGFAMLVFLSAQGVFAGQYTNQFHLRVKAQGESMKDDPVESFNSAIEYATQDAISLGQGTLRGRASSQDAVLDEVWIQKESHLQVVDLQVLNHRFWRLNSPGFDKELITDVEIDVTLEYLDVPMFMNDYQKTVKGAMYRSMAVPGWGQFYNRQHTTGVLYSIAFWTFYVFFIGESQRAHGDSAAINEAALNFQLPAIIFWSLNVSDAVTARNMGKKGLESLRQAYRLDDFQPKYAQMTERGFKLDLILFEVPLYRLWKK